MNRIILILLTVFLYACVENEVKQDFKIPEKMSFPQMTKIENPMSVNSIKSGISELNQFIGGYPPKYSGEHQREQIYKKWTDLLANALSLKESNTSEEIQLYLASELYRQGHNLDVTGSGNKADETISKCLDLYPQSMKCNLSASYFYLSVAPTERSLSAAEKSLNNLRTLYAPQVSSEVESGYVFLYIYKRDVENARKQIIYFNENFPDDSRVTIFEKFKASLDNGIKTKYIND